MNEMLRPETGQPVITADARSASTSDTGTIILHWLTVIAVFVSLATGLAISADAIDAVFPKLLLPILPRGEVWTYHFYAGLSLFFCISAYTAYVIRSKLSERNALSRIKVLTMPKAPAKVRWNAVNVLLHWAIYGVIVAMTATGIAMYLAYGGWVVDVHNYLAVFMLAYVFIHIATHFMYGGLTQILRLFFPSELASERIRAARPFLVASLLGIPVAAAVAAIDVGSRDTLHVPRVDKAPVFSGKMDDPIWKQARPVRIHTFQGANLKNGSGESDVEVRAVINGDKIYFATRWEDPTRSMFRLPLIKKEDGWHMLGTKADTADVQDFYEDKLAILFTHNTDFGSGGITHIGADTLGKDYPAPLNQRGYHYTTDGSYSDMWQWKASRGGMLGYVDDMYIGPPEVPTADMRAGKVRYQAGYLQDPGTTVYSYNYVAEPPGGYRGVVGIRRLPKDYASVMKAMGTFNGKDSNMADDGAKTWLFDTESDPYTPELDSKIPVGTIIPGVIISGKYSGDRADVNGMAHWDNGYWTLEASRVLNTNSRYDVEFRRDVPIYMYVSVYDHNQTRHTRHPRPITLSLDALK